jgi:acetyltransferase-like isoleucine patch superfamily enzyme
MINKMINKILCSIKSRILTKRYVDRGNGRFFIIDPFLKIRINKQKGAVFELNGIFKIKPYLGGNTPVNIILGQNSYFNINGNFSIGHGLTFMLSNNAKLIIGGDGGFTCDCRIMVKNRIEIGRKFNCAWGCTVTDCDWHIINENIPYKPIIFGNNVWIGMNCCILKGAEIGNNTVVAACSKVANKKYPNNVLIAGTRGLIVKENITWRDM